MYIGWALAGLVLFAMVGTMGGSRTGSGLVGLLTGALLGLIWARQLSLRRELQETRALLDRALTRLTRAATPSREGAAATPPATAEPGAPANMSKAPPPLAKPVASAPPRAASTPVQRREPAGPDAVTRAVRRIKQWFGEGNVPVKIGMLVLFAGVAALLKYASDAGMLRVPIGLRLSLVALAAIIALGLGWRQRASRRVFALSLQGGAIGVLLITVFAAFRLYSLLPPQAAFALLLVLVAGVGLLAVLQDALALAVLGLLAGFLAPILTSTGHGSHVALFSYYAVLNVAVLGIAWKRSWRVLNLLGFVATFGIGSAWGVLQYRPEFFASTEPFLILNFLFYLAIPLLYLRRAAPEQRKVIDGCLLFGNPLISLLLQAALLQWRGLPLAFSALVAAVIYVMVAWSIRGRDNFGILRDAWAVLAIALATLAVPLALSANLTGSIFALEGAGLVWLGLRQQRWLSRWGGVALQLAAAVAVLIAYADHASASAASWLNRDFISAMMLVIAAFASATFHARLGSDSLAQRRTAVLLYGWGLCWWLSACWGEIDRQLGWSAKSTALMGLLVVTAWASAEVARRRPRFELGSVVAWTAPLLFIGVALIVIGQLLDGAQPLRGWNLLVAGLGALLGWRALQCLREWPRPALLAQWSWLWRWALIASASIKAAFVVHLTAAGDWSLLWLMLPLCVLAWLALVRPHWIAPPLPEQMARLRAPLLYSVLLVLGQTWFNGLFLAGHAAPMPYLPLLNPLELLLLVIMLLFAIWLDDAAPTALWQRRAMLLGGVGMAFITSATLRAVHQLGDVPWSNPALFDSSLAQMALTVVWSAFGLLAWVVGSRRGERLLWLAGAVTLGAVLVKLLLVDRSHLGNLFGIASFIAYGLLCTVIGYLAPAPPRRPLADNTETADAP